MQPFLSVLTLAFVAASAASAQTFNLRWYTIDGGGTMSSTGGAYAVGATIGQPDAGLMTGGSFSLTGGFWGGALAGTPAPNLASALSRKNCDMPISVSGPTRTSEPRAGGITQVCFTYDDAAPVAGVTIEQDASCPSPPVYGPYTGASVASCSPTANDLCCTFAPALENARAYRLTVPSGSGTAQVELRGLVGDATSDGVVNGGDRSAVIGVWTGSGFSCATDITGNGTTNGMDRSMVVGAWSNPTANCAP